MSRTAEGVGTNTLRMRVEKVEQQVHEMAIGVGVLAEQMRGLREQVGLLREEVQRLLRRPGRWLDTVIAAILGAAATGLVAFLLG